ncbi:AzlC family ABC transporter permease [Pseudohalocynthiibacter aestuariivivens]|jgi:branched chain amino acid efflux pump|uniref:AzlC family ABC transporter permease n=1 Tax=Pseudohalocynthiibacter aestuariivivens TaxID=1591409 RepID=A0ABV5JIA8_9RHOB|nr:MULTISPECIES: AzlC family ABC transporter permease [Pseudohalocynthiibacter]MBS9717494.1 AzlC family ABC transporter permease [Pseudohalocynthiibacter aestuariivivens]MCK0102170.1 AzlC family ABC transporter permease [Pseudohalocynthiibacter sp. F2068]
MTSTTSKSAYWRGIRNGLPFLFVAIPFATLFGVVATEAGFNILETMGFSVLIIGGAAQFAAVQQMVDNSPTLIVIAIALAVNLRMAMYSAALVPYLGSAPLWQRVLLSYVLFDQNYALSVLEYEKRPEMSVGEKVAFFVGAATPIIPAWYGMTLVGALVGSQIPPEYALDFALPITFLSILAPAIRTLAHLLAAVVSVTAALIFAFLPFNLGLLVAAVLAMITGAQTELWLERRGKWT